MTEKTGKTDYSRTMKCGHCGNFAPMKRAAVYSAVSTYEDGAATCDEGYIYNLLECPACSKITLTALYYADWMGGEEDSKQEILYPSDDKLPIGLPVTLNKAYEAALKVRPIDANAYGVLIGRLLEMVCEDRKAQGKDLNAKLADLATKGEIPNNLVGVANGLRNLRNVGAHAVLGELTEAEIPILSSLAKAILEYVYSAPHLAKMAEEKLVKLKTKQRK